MLDICGHVEGETHIYKYSMKLSYKVIHSHYHHLDKKENKNYTTTTISIVVFPLKKIKAFAKVIINKIPST